MADLTFNIVLVAAAFLAVLRCVHREHQLRADNHEIQKSTRELIGQVQAELAKVGSDLDRLRHLIPEGQSPETNEAHEMTQRLVRTIDQIILITRGD